jgi:hypothetical protein
MPSNGGFAGLPAGSGSPIGRMPHDRSRLPIHTAGSTAISSPAAYLGETLGVQGDARARSQHMALLLNHVEQPVPGEVDGDAVGLLEDDPQLVQGLADFHAVAQHVLVEPVGVDAVTHMHGGLGVAAADEHERILYPEVGVVPDAGDQKDVAGAVVGVEVGAVIEVAV